jgi:hypothetical protein
MTAPMFDASIYGPGKEERVKREVVPVTAINDGTWHLILRKGKEPHPLAHKLKQKIMTVTVRGKSQLTAWDGRSPWQGGYETACGLLGAALDLPKTEVQVCPTCKER